VVQLRYRTSSEGAWSETSTGGTIAVLKADLMAGGVSEEQEEDPGLFLTAHGPRHRLQLGVAFPPAIAYRRVTLWTNFAVEVWSDEEDGELLYDPQTATYPYLSWDNIDVGAPPEVGTGQDNFNNWEDFPGEVWIQPLDASAQYPGVPISLDFEGWCLNHQGGYYISASQSDTVMLTVVDVTSVGVHESDQETAKVPSAKADEPKLEHFVTAKDQGDVVLVATVQPDDPAVAEHISWTAEGVDITCPAVGGDRRTASFSSETESGLKVPLTIQVDGTDCWEGVGWIVWSSVVPAGPDRPEMGMTRFQTEITSHMFVVHMLQPAAIITDEDRPALAGPRTVPPPDVPDDQDDVYNYLADLSDGATMKWDSSRQVRINVLNPYDLPFLSPKYQDWVSYPQGVAADNAGNDDLGDPLIQDEDDDPYTLPYPASVWCVDTPGYTIAHWKGEPGQTFEARAHFRSFARAQIGNAWYRISDWCLWRVHFRFIKVDEAVLQLDINGDQDMVDQLWIDNGSQAAADNQGFLD